MPHPQSAVDRDDRPGDVARRVGGQEAHDARDLLRWLPKDSADTYAGQLEGKTWGNPVQERYQGGAFTLIDRTRTTPEPEPLFKTKA